MCVFGAGGDRDRGKRPLMGEIAARLADVVVVTSDNPRSEDPEQIIAEIMAGVARVARSGAEAPPDRSRSPIAARRSPRPSRARGQGDVLVIAGKGHEQGQELAGGRKLPFDDVTVAGEALRARGERLPIGGTGDSPRDRADQPIGRRGGAHEGLGCRARRARRRRASRGRARPARGRAGSPACA